MLTVGLEPKTEEVWRWVMDESVGMIGIHGVGGVGKTTLLKQIYKKLTIFPHCFDSVIWVTVSRNPSLLKVQDDIWKRIGVFNAEWTEKSSEDKAKDIHDALSKTKFVLLLDDLGKPLDLKKVGVVKPEAEEDSDQILQVCSPDLGNNKIIFTTRSEELCRKMGAQATLPIKSLEWEHAWELFTKMVGDDKLCDPKLLELAQLIARTCKGLPMLLRTVGRAMASKTTCDEWEAAIEGLQFRVAEEGGKVFVPFLLWLCFKSLNRNSLFGLVFYSLFPEDFTILKNELIDLWICQRIIGRGRYEVYEDFLNLGYKTVDALVGACLLEEEEEEINGVKMLDLIREFVLEVKYKNKIFRGPFLRYKNVGVGWVLQMSISIRDVTLVSESLATFLLDHNPFVMVKFNAGTDAVLSKEDIGEEDIGEDDSNMAVVQFSMYKGVSIFGKMFLTVLDLSNSGVEELPRDIANVISLEYLNLSRTWIEHLPVEIRKLLKLKCLNLEYNELLRVVPKQLISGLPKLEVLKLFRCGYSVEEMKDNIMTARYMNIEPIFCLARLKVLSITITCPYALQKLFSNPNLSNKTQSLSLEVFWGVESLDISMVVNMKNLHKLEIHQCEDLKKLNGFSRSIEFERVKSFENLREIALEKCSSLTELTWVVLVPHLKIFAVKDCDEIEEIVSTRCLEEKFNGQHLEPFAELEVFVLESLPKLESIYGETLLFQQLKKMEVTGCCMLKKLPLNSTNAKADKVIIETEENWWNHIEWDDDIAKGIFIPCFKV